MIWNFDLTQAPRGKNITRSVKTKDGFKDVTDIVPERVWLASVCGKVIPTYWVESRKNWAGFQDTPPVAWQPYLVPEHPFAAATQGEAAATAPTNVSLPIDERSGEGANAGGDNVTGVENAHQISAGELVSNSSAFILEDCGSGA